MRYTCLGQDMSFHVKASGGFAGCWHGGTNSLQANLDLAQTQEVNNWEGKYKEPRLWGWRGSWNGWV